MSKILLIFFFTSTLFLLFSGGFVRIVYSGHADSDPACIDTNSCPEKFWCNGDEIWYDGYDGQHSLSQDCGAEGKLCRDGLPGSGPYISDAECYSPGDTSPPPPPPGSDDPGWCTGKKNAPGSLPRVILDQNNCSSGYKPDLTFTTTGRGAEIRNINCRCIPESTPICSARGKSCTLNGDECQEGPGCETVVCVNATSTVRGICVDTSISCPKNNVMCSSNEDCQSLGGMCDLFTCWAVGRSKLCRFGSQPTPPPPASPTSAGGLPCDPDSPDGPGIRTAIGCIHTSPKGFVKDFLTFGVGISGGLAFLMMLLGAFQMLTSAGNPETLQAGRERFVNAIIGLMIIIFAVLLLQIIGFGILRIPGFGG